MELTNYEHLEFDGFTQKIVSEPGKKKMYTPHSRYGPPRRWLSDRKENQGNSNSTKKLLLLEKTFDHLKPEAHYEEQESRWVQVILIYSTSRS